MMGKPRMIGMNKSYIPNNRADMRHRRKLYQHGREVAERNTCNPKSNRRFEKEIKRWKTSGGKQAMEGADEQT